MLGRIDGDAPADFTVEVEPQEILIFRRDADHAVGNASGMMVISPRRPDVGVRSCNKIFRILVGLITGQRDSVAVVSV